MMYKYIKLPTEICFQSRWGCNQGSDCIYSPILFVINIKMADLCPWQNSDIKLQHLIRQPPIIKKRPNNKHSISQGQTQNISVQIFGPKSRIPRFRRFKTSALGPTEGSQKLIEQKRSLTKIIKQTLDIKFDEDDYQRLRPLKKKDIEMLEKQRLRQRDIIKQQLASIFLKQVSAKDFTTLKSKKEINKTSFKSDTEIFLPLKLLNKQKRQNSLVLPKIKVGNRLLGNRKERIQRDKRYFFEEHESMDLATYRFNWKQ